MSAPGFEDDLWEAFRDGFFPAHLGIELVGWEEGAVRLHLPAKPHLMQNYGVVQGGALATLADVGMAWATLSVVHPSMCPTITLNMTYLAPVREAAVDCEARVVRAGRSVAATEATITTEEGVVAATAVGTFLVRPRSG
ncbi:MAG: PaaI family thioesterase [Actinomycetota bacterium]